MHTDIYVLIESLKTMYIIAFAFLVQFKDLLSLLLSAVYLVTRVLLAKFMHKILLFVECI